MEKRQFHLSTQSQPGESDYWRLYKLIDKQDGKDLHVEEVMKNIKAQFSNIALDNTARYLQKLIIDSLIHAKMEKDNSFTLWQGLMRVRIMQERSLPEESLRELRRIRQKAAQSQNHIIEYLTFRQELNQLSDENFSGIDDNYLVEMQMKAKETLRMVHHVEGHYSLYELLRFRLARSGKIVSEENKKELNDLVLTEISLVAGKARNSFESRKLHLLFQSFYFTDISDYRSALRSFHELNTLFENHPELHSHPPLDYLSSLQGILDSLLSIRHFEEMTWYLSKMQAIDTGACPAYFKMLVEKTIAVYTLAFRIGTEDFQGAIDYIATLPSGLFNTYQLVHDEKHAELCFYCVLAYFRKKDYRKAHKYLTYAFRRNDAYPQLAIYKALRLLNMIIHYEQKDTEYLSYDIRSYKRSADPRTGLSRTEKVIFKIIQEKAFANTRHQNNILAKKLKKDIDALSTDRYELQLLKYMDFLQWINQKLGV